MLNLEQYKEYFSIEDTEERCEQVLTQIEPEARSLMERFMQENEIIRANPSSYIIKSYAVALKTVLGDLKNPKYAPQLENTRGKRYFISIEKVDGGNELNRLTLEFNGLDQTWRVYIDVRFYSIWHANIEKKVEHWLADLPEEIGFYQNLNKHEWEQVDRSVLEKNVMQLVKSQKRPFFSIGKSYPLIGQLDEEEVLEEAHRVFQALTPVIDDLEKERQESVQAAYIFSLLEGTDAAQALTIYGQTYQLSFEPAVKVKSHLTQQVFKLFDQDQLLVKGQLQFYEYSPRHSPSQRISVKVENHRMIYAPIRQLLGTGDVDWKLTKRFYTQKQDNQLLSAKAESAVKEHGFEVHDQTYPIGRYRNSTHDFSEEVPVLKGRLVLLSVLFASVMDIIQLQPGDSTILPEDEVDDEEQELESNFELQAIHSQIESSNFTFSKQIIRDFHLNLTALEDKHFVILSGISGTGKTQLVRLYANAVYGLINDEPNPYLSIIPVHPDWMDSTALFGYYSSFEKDYLVPEFLRMVLKAEQERDKPHFILLDEMNLARVEYYLSDFLSAIESNVDIHLHNREGLDVPRSITLPPNIYIIGTINVDETTYAISDKVLDRAFVMNLSDVDLAAFKKNWASDIDEPMEKVFSFLMEFHEKLVPYNLHFGYRTMEEMLKKIEKGLHLEGGFKMTWQEAADRATGEKVLPKIRGDERIKALFSELYALLGNLDGESYSLNLLKRMEEELDRYGATQFWQ